ncbi:MAG: Na+-transporting NADH:ubiquinone oxidoreductase subunit B [Parasphingorhabdus sp.]|jgi:Na+-transporting NADH:ubiquinone oxidoreductase subunit B
METTRSPLLCGAHSVQRISTLRLLATVPVLIAAIFNTGSQFLLALDIQNGQGVGDWRETIIHNLGVSPVRQGILETGTAGLVHLLPLLIFAILTGALWERTFSVKRDRPFETGFIYTAILFTLLMHPGISLVHVVFGMSFAVVFGSGIFGGNDKSIVTPALLGAAVVQISFPGALTDHPLWSGLSGYSGTTIFAAYHQQGDTALAWADIDRWGAFFGSTQGLIGTTSVAAILLGGLVLVYARIASLHIISGIIIGVVLTSLVFNQLGGGISDMSWSWHFLLGALAFGTIFIATDPVVSSSTPVGRWIQGLLTGVLFVFMRVVNPSHSDGVIQVLLLMSMLSPLIDHGVIWMNIRRRVKSSVR